MKATNPPNVFLNLENAQHFMDPDEEGPAQVGCQVRRKIEIPTLEANPPILSLGRYEHEEPPA